MDQIAHNKMMTRRKANKIKRETFDKFIREMDAVIREADDLLKEYTRKNQEYENQDKNS